MKTRFSRTLAVLAGVICGASVMSMTAGAGESTEENPLEHDTWATRYVQNAPITGPTYSANCYMIYDTDGQRIDVTSASSQHSVTRGENVVHVWAQAGDGVYTYNNTGLYAAGDSYVAEPEGKGSIKCVHYVLSAYTSNLNNIFYAEGRIDNVVGKK